jgi:hypothetical protein
VSTDSGERESIDPTYDSREMGERFTVETRESGGWREVKTMPDPFVNHTLHVRGWRNALRVLLRRYSVTVIVGGDRDIVEDVCELDNDYKGIHGSSRHREWDENMEQALGDFAARLGEHDVS